MVNVQTRLSWSTGSNCRCPAVDSDTDDELNAETLRLILRVSEERKRTRQTVQRLMRRLARLDKREESLQASLTGSRYN